MGFVEVEIGFADVWTSGKLFFFFLFYFYFYFIFIFKKNNLYLPCPFLNIFFLTFTSLWGRNGLCGDWNWLRRRTDKWWVIFFLKKIIYIYFALSLTPSFSPLLACGVEMGFAKVEIGFTDVQTSGELFFFNLKYNILKYIPLLIFYFLFFPKIEKLELI